MDSRTKRLSDLDPELTSLPADIEKRILSILEDRDKIILLQRQQIERLDSELRQVRIERDLLQVRLTDRVDPATPGSVGDSSR